MGRVLMLMLVMLGLGSEATRIRRFRGRTRHIQYDLPKGKTMKKYMTNGITPIEQYYYHALVDHFAPVSQQEFWAQRYFVDDVFWGGEQSPVFLYIGGEGPLSATAISSRNFIYYAAKQHKALLVAVEHRFYGKSYPKPNMSVENLKYLSSEQALADLARMQAHVTQKYLLQKSPWIAFGGSYPGSLAAWYKLKFPSMVVGSIASSAPIYVKENFFEYMEVVGKGLQYFGGNQCYASVEKAMETMHKLLMSGPSDREKVEQALYACAPVGNELDISVFEATIMGYFQDIAQYNGLRPGEMTLLNVCDMFQRNGGVPNAFETLQAFVNENRKGSCVESKFEGHVNATVDQLRNESFDGLQSSRQWFYQTCNEFGYFQTADSQNSPFHTFQEITVSSIGLEVCKRVFGIDVSPAIESTNLNYGSLAITVENVTFPSGTIDPWHELAVKNTTTLKTSSCESIYIEGTAHCADMRAPSVNDTQAMKWAHERIAQAIATYLGVKGGFDDNIELE